MTVALPFFSDCVNWPHERLAALEYLIDEGAEISRDEFLDRADADEADIPPAGDWGVSYFELEDEPVVWYVWSAIEHVYALDGTVERVQDLALDRDATADSGLPFFVAAIGRAYVGWPEQQRPALDLLLAGRREISRVEFTGCVAADADALPPEYGPARYYELPGFACAAFTWDALLHVYASAETIAAMQCYRRPGRTG